jgi:hypothetical protein
MLSTAQIRAVSRNRLSGESHSVRRRESSGTVGGSARAARKAVPQGPSKARPLTPAQIRLPNSWRAFTYASPIRVARSNYGQSMENCPSLERKRPGGEVRERPNRTHC